MKMSLAAAPTSGGTSSPASPCPADVLAGLAVQANRRALTFADIGSGGVG